MFPINQLLNCIDPVDDTTSPTNNPFESCQNDNNEPSIHHDGRRCGFGSHAFSGIGNLIYDGVLRYDVDNNPDNVINSGPDKIPPEGNVEDTISFQWELPNGVSLPDYKNKLFDYWTVRSGNNVPSDPEDKNFSVY